MKSLEEQKPEEFVAGRRVGVVPLPRQGRRAHVGCAVAEDGGEIHLRVLVGASLDDAAARTLAANGKAALAFDLQLEELLEMQRNKTMVKEHGKIKLDVNKTLEFLNEKMRF